MPTTVTGSSTLTEKTRILLPVATIMAGIIAIVGTTGYVVSMGATLNAKVNSLDVGLTNLGQRFGNIEQKIEHIGLEVSVTQRLVESRIAVLESKVSAIEKKEK